jgi:hypothetical protein
MDTKFDLPTVHIEEINQKVRENWRESSFEIAMNNEGSLVLGDFPNEDVDAINVNLEDYH